MPTAENRNTWNNLKAERFLQFALKWSKNMKSEMARKYFLLEVSTGRQVDEKIRSRKTKEKNWK